MNRKQLLVASVLFCLTGWVSAAAAATKITSTFATSDYSEEAGKSVIYFEEEDGCDGDDPFGCEVVEIGCTSGTLEIIIPWLTDKQVSDWLRKSRDLTTTGGSKKVKWSPWKIEVGFLDDDWVAYFDTNFGGGDEKAGLAAFFSDIRQGFLFTVSYGNTTLRLPALPSDQENFKKLQEQCTRPTEPAKTPDAPAAKPG